MTNDGQPQAVSSPSCASSSSQRPPTAGPTMEAKFLLQSPRANDSALLSFGDDTPDSADALHVEVSPNPGLDDCPPSEEDEGFFDGKPILEGSPTKPTIMSGNALHLHLEEHDISGSAPSIRFAPDPPSVSKPQTNDRSADAPHLVRPAPRVRFRSRVRIASGLHRHRQHHPEDSPDSSSSSLSSSPCSSLSVPLRYQADENSALGPLGRRLSSYAAQGGFKHRVMASPVPQRQSSRATVRGQSSEASERSSLLKPGTRVRTYGEDERRSSGEQADVHPEVDEDAEFGPWPRRLLNHHWWWWQLEPILCCFCVDDSDTDD
ncbi:hypothetical protein GLOTRDRAFT_135680 [Gloeophyllum trabeum ATCC 11539]|uniref:Uncharacterized protein n=1 Tax=Gloeophyllum trabeum (strain ATCC 11539 / FP-39264 / Madison 617) TaxID=670483 RepID=S7QNL3_GLOTA|nr:uncharacterized protein GLOTRDRAFT_135680 [Gloeophyllum trabeum ATCC 11539]EPQ61136.1 hypothetical protein GLOTRDRAFT_135680 [Gloeophyllum trabeum ATCC 11539]